MGGSLAIPLKECPGRDKWGKAAADDDHGDKESAPSLLGELEPKCLQCMMSIGNSPEDKPRETRAACFGHVGFGNQSKTIIEAKKEIEHDAQDWIGIQEKNGKSCFPGTAVVL